MTVLSGINVLDLSRDVAGPQCTVLLSDMGAKVIKIEPLEGDRYRVLGPYTRSLVAQLYRGKKCIALDLRKEEGKKIFWKLIERSDILVENFRPGVMKRLGVDYESVRKVKPQIIFCSISGFGQEGPYAQYAAYDPVIQAMSGMMETTGEPGRAPIRIGPSVVDETAGLIAAYSIVLALLRRERLGEGSRIDISMFDVASMFMGGWIGYYAVTGQLPQKLGSGWLDVCPYQAYKAGDGRYVMIAASSQPFWISLCKVLKLEKLIDDPKFSTNSKRVQNRELLNSLITEAASRFTSAKLVSLLRAEEIPCGPVNNVDQLLKDQQLALRQMIVNTNYGGKEKVMTAGNPVKIEGIPSEVESYTSLHGQHTFEVLRELGYSVNDIDELRNHDAIYIP